MDIFAILSRVSEVNLAEVRKRLGFYRKPLRMRWAQVLPDSLTDAILQASEATHTAIEAGSNRVVVRAAACSA